MNTSEHTPQDPTDDVSMRPLAYWLRTVDALIAQEFATAFAGSGISRREWMLLNAVSGEVALPGLAARLARKGKHLRSLADRGWVEQNGDGTWALTDAGREAKDSLGVAVNGIRARVAGAASPEDLATTMTSLEAIAREFGWDESSRMPRRRGFGRGFGPGFGRGFGHGDEHGHGHGHGHHHGERCGDRGHGHHRDHGHHGGPRHAEHAYERGFDAGFARGRDAGTSASDAA